MAGRRINKILNTLHGQWHVIDLHDNITRDFLVNNSQDFFDSLVKSIKWPENVGENRPYVRLTTSGSDHQYVLTNNYENSGNNRDDEQISGNDAGSAN